MDKLKIFIKSLTTQEKEKLKDDLFKFLGNDDDSYLNLIRFFDLLELNKNDKEQQENDN